MGQRVSRNRPRASAWKHRLFERPSFKTAVEEWFSADALDLFEREREVARTRVGRILAEK